MLSAEDLRAIADGDGTDFIFDLSKIPSDIFAPLLTAISKYGHKIMTKIAFSCGLMAEFDADKGYPSKVLKSIAILNKNYFHHVTKCLIQVISKSHILESFSLLGIYVNPKDLIKISGILSYCKTIKRVCFYDVHIKGEIVARMLKDLSACQIRSITFRRCNLPDEVAPFFIDFIKQSKKIHKGDMIKKIDISENSFTDASLSRIASALTGKPDEYNYEIDNTEMQIQAMRDENESLKIQIERLKCLIQEVKENDALFILGEGSPALIDKLKGYDHRIANLLSL